MISFRLPVQFPQVKEHQGGAVSSHLEFWCDWLAEEYSVHLKALESTKALGWISRVTGKHKGAEGLEEVLLWIKDEKLIKF
jgi:hypothetical protein